MKNLIILLTLIIIPNSFFQNECLLNDLLMIEKDYNDYQLNSQVIILTNFKDLTLKSCQKVTKIYKNEEYVLIRIKLDDQEFPGFLNNDFCNLTFSYINITQKNSLVFNHLYDNNLSIRTIQNKDQINKFLPQKTTPFKFTDNFGCEEFLKNEFPIRFEQRLNQIIRSKKQQIQYYVERKIQDEIELYSILLLKDNQSLLKALSFDSLLFALMIEFKRVKDRLQSFTRVMTWIKRDNESFIESFLKANQNQYVKQYITENDKFQETVEKLIFDKINLLMDISIQGLIIYFNPALQDMAKGVSSFISDSKLFQNIAQQTSELLTFALSQTLGYIMGSVLRIFGILSLKRQKWELCYNQNVIKPEMIFQPQILMNLELKVQDIKLNKIYFCEVQQVEVDDRFLGFQVHLKIDLHWKCDLRVFINRQGQTFQQNTINNDINCLPKGKFDLDKQQIKDLKSYFEQESIFQKMTNNFEDNKIIQKQNIDIDEGIINNENKIMNDSIMNIENNEKRIDIYIQLIQYQLSQKSNFNLNVLIIQWVVNNAKQFQKKKKNCKKNLMILNVYQKEMSNEYQQELENTLKLTEQELEQIQSKFLMKEIEEEDKNNELKTLKAKLKQQEIQFKDEKEKWIKEKVLLRKELINMEIEFDDRENILRQKISELDEIKNKYEKIHEKHTISQVELNTVRKSYIIDVEKLKQQIKEYQDEEFVLKSDHKRKQSMGNFNEYQYSQEQIQNKPYLQTNGSQASLFKSIRKKTIDLKKLQFQNIKSVFQNLNFKNKDSLKTPQLPNKKNKDYINSKTNQELNAMRNFKNKMDRLKKEIKQFSKFQIYFFNLQWVIVNIVNQKKLIIMKSIYNKIKLIYQINLLILKNYFYLKLIILKFIKNHFLQLLKMIKKIHLLNYYLMVIIYYYLMDQPIRGKLIIKCYQMVKIFMKDFLLKAKKMEQVNI